MLSSGHVYNVLKPSQTSYVVNLLLVLISNDGIRDVIWVLEHQPPPQFKKVNPNSILPLCSLRSTRTDSTYVRYHISQLTIQFNNERERKRKQSKEWSTSGVKFLLENM